MSERKFESGRYRKRSHFFLDHSDGGYINTFSVLDGEKETGITVTNTGHSKFAAGHKRTIIFDGKEFHLMRDAIFAYEDKAASDAVKVD